MRRIKYKNIPVNNEVHVWSGEVAEFSMDMAVLFSCLSADEVARSERFRLPSLRDEFVTARGLLRQLLGYYLNLAPAEVTIGYSDMGKPLLTSPGSATGLNFNLSHSRNALGFVIAGGVPVGIDLEPLDRAAKLEEIVSYYLTDHEEQAIRNIPRPRRRERLVRYWTYKEALLKAMGVGLGGGMQRIELKFNCNGQVRLHSNESLADCSNNWSLLPIDTGSEFVAGIAVACIDPVILGRRLSELPLC